MEFNTNVIDPETDSTTPPYHKEYLFQVLKNAVMFEGTQAAASGDTETVCDLVIRVKNFERQSHLLDVKNEFGLNMLHYFVVYKNLSMVKLLLDNHADCDCTTNDTGLYTPLHLSILYYNAFLDSLDTSFSHQLKVYQNPPNLQMIELLIEKGANINHQDAEGNTPLILACKYNHLSVVKMLVQVKQVEIDLANYDGETALHVACTSHLAPAVITLLSYGARVNCKNKFGHTPVFVACMVGDEEILKLLLDHAPHLKQSLINDHDKDGSSPLMVAIQSKDCTIELVKFLLSLESDLNRSNYQGNNVLHLFPSKCDPEIIELILDHNQSLLNKSNCNKEQPLHIAARHDDVNIAFLLIEKGASMEARDSNDMTPFMVSIVFKHKNIMKLFIECGCEVYSRGKHGKTVLDWAIEKEATGLLEVLTELYDTNQSMNLLDEHGNTLVHAAARYHVPDCLSVVLSTSYGEIFTSSYNKVGFTPLHCAAEYGNIDCVQKLLRNGAFTVAEDQDCNTPLHIACQKGHLKVAKVLMEHASVDWEANNKVLGTPLSCAAARGHSDVVKYLLSKDVSIDGGYEHCLLQSTPLMLACKNGHAGTAKVLLNNVNVNVDITNSSGHNCLTEAILNGHREVTMTLITSSHWQKLMRFCVNDQETPMRLLIKHMSDLAEVALDQCIAEKHYDDDTAGSNVDTITYFYEFLDDFQDIQHAKFYHRLLNIFFKPTTAIEASFENTDALKWPDESASWGPNMYNKQQHPLMLMVTHQRTKLLTHPVVGSLLHYKWKTFGAPSFFVNLIFYIVFLAFFTLLIIFTPLPNGPICRVDGCWSQWGPWSNCAETCDRNVSTQNRTRYCNDPLPMLGGKLCDGKSIDVQVINCYYSGIDDVMNDAIENISQADFDFQPDCNGCTAMPLRNRSRGANECEKAGLTEREYSVIAVVDYIILSSSAVQLLREIVEVWRRKVTYFYDLENFVELPMFLLTITFCVGLDNEDCFCTSAANWQVGAVALFLAWIDLLMFLKRLPFTGIPINILLNIVYTFVTLAIVPTLLILSFAFPFYMLLVRPGELTPFSTPGRAFIKTLVMTTGEFEFDTIFINSDDDNSDGEKPTLYFPGASYFLWVVFIILMPVLFNNLLVGLAVGDTAAERARATLTKLGLQVRLSLEVEESIPLLRGMCRKKRRTYRSANNDWFLFKASRYTSQKKLLTQLKNDKELSKALNNLQLPMEEPIKEIKEILMKQTDDLEKTVSEKFNVIESLIESTKQSIQLIQQQHKAANIEDMNDASFISSRKMSTIDKPNFMAFEQDVSRRKSIIRRPSLTNHDISLPHHVQFSKTSIHHK